MKDPGDRKRGAPGDSRLHFIASFDEIDGPAIQVGNSGAARHGHIRDHAIDIDDQGSTAALIPAKEGDMVVLHPGHGDEIASSAMRLRRDRQIRPRRRGP